MPKPPFPPAGSRMPFAWLGKITCGVGVMLLPSSTAGKMEDVMTERIDETLKKIAAATSTTSTPTSSSTESAAKRRQAGLLGDPECPHCSGLGYLRLDLPLDHADFGKLQPCTCRHSQISQQVHRRLFSLSNLEELRHLTFENFQPRGRIGLGASQANTLERAFN